MEIKENVAYWCKTKELAKEFLKECRKQDIKWTSGDDLYKTYWEDYGENTCYTYNYVSKVPMCKNENLTYCDKDFYIRNSIEIIEYKGVSYGK